MAMRRDISKQSSRALRKTVERIRRIYETFNKPAAVPAKIASRYS